MIKKIEIVKPHKTIPDNFKLELEKMTVITGENNSGKTNFCQAVISKDKEENFDKVKFLDEEGDSLIPDIVYIAAENINPADSEAKSSAKTTGLVTNLSKLFSDFEIKFELTEQNKIIGYIETLIGKTNENIKNFTGKDEHKLTYKKGDLVADIIIQSLVASISGLEGKDPRKLNELGQGTQRIIIASILKAYVDILIENKIHKKNSMLIIFEEPEIYLHPKLKRTLNATLEKISEQEDHQVIITTHDPYFVFLNLEEKKKIISFKKGKDGLTIPGDKVIEGIEDELLFIFLYEKIKGNNLNIKNIEIDGFTKRDYFWPPEPKYQNYPQTLDNLTYIRHQIHYLGSNPFTLGLLSEKGKNLDGKNYYTQKELADAIKKMSEILGK